MCCLKPLWHQKQSASAGGVWEIHFKGTPLTCFLVLWNTPADRATRWIPNKKGPHPAACHLKQCWGCIPASPSQTEHHEHPPSPKGASIFAESGIIIWWKWHSSGLWAAPSTPVAPYLFLDLLLFSEPSKQRCAVGFTNYKTTDKGNKWDKIKDITSASINYLCILF